MDETVCALFYKKYSLNAVKLQILSLLSLILLSCILSLIKFKINNYQYFLQRPFKIYFQLLLSYKRKSDL